MLRTLFRLFVATSLYRWLKPKLKNLIVLVFVVVLTIYLHGEYLEWSDRANNSKYIGLSYVIKNVLLFISIGFYLLFLRIQHLRLSETANEQKIYGDGFDKYRRKVKLKSKSDQILEKN